MTVDRVGRFEIVGRIAVGDGTERLLGREPSGRPVAIKRIPEDGGRGSAARHPNLVEIIGVENVGDDRYLVTEYLDGENLAALVRRLIKRRERLAYGLAAHMMAEVCDGLQAAHQAGELHGAVSLGNVFVTYGGDIKLLDLGTVTPDLESTFRSPEQANGRPLGRQSDLYSVGVVLYELTTLHRLFGSAAELDREIPPPSTQVADYPSELEVICMRALAHDPAARQVHAAELRDELLAAARALGVDDDPGQSLASKLMRLFGERVANKRELVDRVRVGVPLGDLVPAEVDEEIDVPLVTRPELAALEVPSLVDPVDDETRTDPVPFRISVQARVAPTPAPPASGTRWGVIGLLVLAIVGGGAAGGWLRLRAHAGGVAIRADARIDAPPPPADAALPDFVTISIDSDPTGAKVLLDGDDRGVTPTDLRVKGNTAPIKLQLQRAGFAPKSIEVVPDRDQQLHETLERSR